MALNAEEDRAISRLWKISKTVHEMVRDRVGVLVIFCFQSAERSTRDMKYPRMS